MRAIASQRSPLDSDNRATVKPARRPAAAGFFAAAAAAQQQPQQATKPAAQHV
jgi:hypothetical protein